jgi:GntR family transcriptional regulator
MLLHLVDVSSEPLHSQISRQIRARILSGDLAEGDALPSIRVMAREQHVSVITVQRAYDDLDRDGLIVSKRGKGFFVAGLTGGQKRNMALDRLSEKLAPVIKHAAATGLESSEIIRVVKQILKTGGDGQ